MGFIGKLFGGSGNSEDIQRFKEETLRLIEPGIRLVRRNSEGGYVKIIFSGKETEIAFCLMDSRLHEYNRKFCENDWKRTLCYIASGKDTAAIFNMKDAEIIFNMTKVFVANEKDDETQIDFVHFYPFYVNKNPCKEWIVTYMEEKFPNYRLKIDRDSVSFII